MNNVRDIQRLNELELEKGLVDKASWHEQFKKSAYIHVGGLSFDLSEGDILAIFSQFGEIVDLDLVRDKISGKSKGFAFIGYEDQRSTVLTVDNMNGIQILGRTIKVDHTLNYQGRKPGKNEDEAEFAEKERKRKLAILPPHLKPREEGHEDEDEQDTMNDKRPSSRAALPADLDKNDPMSAYFYQKNIEKERKRSEKAERKAEKAERKAAKKSKKKHSKDSDDESRRHRNDEGSQRRRDDDEWSRRYRDEDGNRPYKRRRDSPDNFAERSERKRDKDDYRRDDYKRNRSRSRSRDRR